MGEPEKSDVNGDIVNKEAPQLAAVLKEMKIGLDNVRSKVQALTAKVRENHFPTADGISYLETKNLLLLNYCQSLVYYLTRKAKGLSIEGHPVVKSLVENRLFLEKIRPIDKKMQYQIQKLTRVTVGAEDKVDSNENEDDAANKTEDDLKYRPNPDMLISKIPPTPEDGDGVYRPPKFAPIVMENDKVSRQERDIRRKEKLTLRQASQSAFVRDMMNDVEGKPEEITDFVGTESKEVIRYKAQQEDRDKREEEAFTRAPLTREDKKKMKHMRKSRNNGLLSLADGFFDEVKSIPLEENDDNQMSGLDNGSSRGRKFNKRMRKH